MNESAPDLNFSGHSENQGALRLGDVLSPRQVVRLGQWSLRRRNIIKRIWARKAGRTLAIHMQCLECCGEDVEAIRGCTAVCCPLWHFRPFQKRKKVNKA